MSDLDESVAEDTSVSEDTSTNEETQDTEDLDDFELSDEQIGDESAETKEPEESDKDTAATESEDETEEESEADADKESEEDTTPVDKQQKARIAYQEREARRRAEKSQAQSEYLEGAEDDRDLALRQLQIDAYNNRVEGNNNKLQNGIDKAVAAIDLFRNGSPEVKDELANSLDDFERMYVKRDQNGDPVEVVGDVYQYLQAKADSIKRLTGIGARQQQTNKANQKARTLTPPAKTPKKAAVDPDLAAFDEEAARY